MKINKTFALNPHGILDKNNGLKQASKIKPTEPHKWISAGQTGRLASLSLWLSRAHRPWSQTANPKRNTSKPWGWLGNAPRCCTTLTTRLGHRWPQFPLSMPSEISFTLHKFTGMRFIFSFSSFNKCNNSCSLVHCKKYMILMLYGNSLAEQVTMNAHTVRMQSPLYQDSLTYTYMKM